MKKPRGGLYSLRMMASSAAAKTASATAIERVPQALELPQGQ
jgi:hypothetical protein